MKCNALPPLSQSLLRYPDVFIFFISTGDLEHTYKIRSDKNYYQTTILLELHVYTQHSLQEDEELFQLIGQALDKPRPIW